MPLSQRARSQSRDVCKHKRPKFQTRFRARASNQSTMNIENPSDSKLSSGFQNDTRGDANKSNQWVSQKKCKLDDQNFNRTSSRLQNLNVSHHDPNLCVCADCTCGRHLCQFHVIKPDLTKNTIYQKDYWRKNPIENRINISKEYDRLTGPNLDINSTYLKDYDPKQGQIERPRPEDLLKTGGPCNNLTSYSSGFPGYKGGNQYVKPTDRHTRGYFPLRSRSTYTNSFLGQPGNKGDHQRIPDNLKTGSNWYGNTTYENFFKQPNPEDYASKYKVKEKLEKNPDYNRQYETTYRNNFLGRQPGVCPAKVIIETRSKGFFSSSKGKFAENTDYKAMDPSFHAISTSKHFYV